MSALKAARDALAVLLEGMTVDTTTTGPDPFVVAPVLTSSPESVPTPCAIIQPDDPYLSTGEEDATFAVSEYLVRFEVYLLVDLVDNATASAELDALLEQVIDRVGPSGWWLTGVSQPGPMHTSEWMAHGVRVGVGTWITL